MAAVLAAPASAGIIERDWKTPGDGLLTYDSANHREWLDLTQSIRAQFGGSTSQENFDNTLAQLGPRGLFDGFTWATGDDVREFAISGGIDIATQDYDTNADPVMNVVDLLGITVPSDPRYSVGIVNDRRVAVFGYDLRAASAYLAVGLSPGDLDRAATSGLMLYRGAISEPPAHVLTVVAVALFLLAFKTRCEGPRSLQLCTVQLLRAVLGLLVAAMFAVPASAGIMERDWKTPGDGLLTYDDANHREWLDLTESILAQFGGNTGQEVLDNALAQLEPGGQFEEFTWASPDDVRGLAISAEIDISTFDYATNAEPVMNAIDLLGITAPSIPRFSVGHLNDGQKVSFGYVKQQAPSAGVLIGIGAPAGLSRPATSGLMLFREAIPEPPSGLLAVIAVASVLIGYERQRGRSRWIGTCLARLLGMLLLTIFAAPASAEIMERDWKTPGDGLLTYDTVSGHEWLELTESVLTNFEGHSYQEYLDNAVAELAPSGRFEDFTWASPEDVQDLAVSAGIDLATEDYGANGEPVGTVLDILGITVFDAPRFTFGVLNDQQFALFEYRPPQSLQPPYARLRITSVFGGDAARTSYIGLMLYREAIPEPPASVLTIVAAGLLLVHLVYFPRLTTEFRRRVL